MILFSDRPPDGTVRDWLNHRARSSDTAFVFSESGDSLS